MAGRGAPCHACHRHQDVRFFPRPIGAMLALRGDGQLIGSVSGGCIEDDLAQRLQMSPLSGHMPERVTYGLNAEEAHRFGLPCGGSMELVLEPLHTKSLVAELAQRLQQRQLVRRSLDLQSGDATLSQANAGDVLTLDNEILHSIHGPQWQLLVIGAGQLSRYLVEMAVALDYRITVVRSDAQEHSRNWDLPGVTSRRRTCPTMWSSPCSPMPVAPSWHSGHPTPGFVSIWRCWRHSVRSLLCGCHRLRGQ